MNALFPANRRAERFAALVDALQDPGSTTGADQRYAPLLEVIGTLRTAADDAPAPRADYVADLRSRLMAAADTALVPTDARLVIPQRHTPKRKQSKITAAVAGLVLIGSSAGIAVAAQSSVPGDGLYPIKRGLEHVNEAMSFSEAGRGRDLLGQAGSRLDEVDTLLDRDASDAEVAATLRSFNSSAGDGADLLFRTYQREGNDADIATVRDFAGTQMGVLTQLADTAPSALQADFADAAQLLTDLDQQATTLCSDCGARSALELPAELRLVSAESSLIRLLDLTTLVAPGPGTTATTPASGGGSAGTPATAGVPAAGAPVSTTDTSAITLPPLEDLLGGLGGTPASTDTSTSTGTGTGPLGDLLPTPSVGTSELPNVDDVTDQVKKDLGSVTDPLKPKP